MSTSYVPVGWTRSKIVYDAVLVAAVAGFLIAFQKGSELAGFGSGPQDGGSVVIRIYGDCALVLMTLALSIGPLARLDTRFLPLLYNRRHLGVITFAIALTHAHAVFDWYYAFSPIDPWLAMIVSDQGFGATRNAPYVPFGAVALLLLGLLAFTSHDFWLRFLGPGLWKTLHLSIYVVYALVVAHLSFGALQSAQTLALPILAGSSAVLVLSLHLAAGVVETRRRRRQSAESDANWLRVSPPEEIPDGKARIVRPADGEAIAIFRQGRAFFGIGHRCAHQGGPLGEGLMVGDCVICPWHGFEYRLIDGCSPPPFTEQVPTYRVKLSENSLWVDRRPMPLGTLTEPFILEEIAA